MKKEFPTLYALAKTEKIKQWTTWVEQNENGSATIHTESGYIDGKIVDRPKTITKGKNIGKSNETTPFIQALSQAQSKWNSKKDKNYEEEIPDPNNYLPNVMLPMLAKGMGKGKIIFPCFMQPKLNGICDLTEDIPGNPHMVIHHSRGGKTFHTLQHLNPYIQDIAPPAPLHGELFHPDWSLQKIGSYTKDLKEDAHRLQFWVYDIAWVGPTFEERWEWITENIHDNIFSPIIVTPTIIVNNRDEVKRAHDVFISNGFEGGMLKNKNGIYMFQYNSDDLEKVKEFEDSEFKIIGGKQATGTHEGCVVYTCITESGLEFDVSPKGSLEDRQKWYLELENDIGKMLTVRYPEFTDSGIPSQPIGLAIRDYE